MRTHFIIFELALGPLWYFAVPNKYIRRGARCERTNPNDNTTPFPWMSSNSRVRCSLCEARSLQTM